VLTTRLFVKIQLAGRSNLLASPLGDLSTGINYVHSLSINLVCFDDCTAMA
jgi:hypothetical protein